MRSTFAVVNPGHELTWTGRFLSYKAVDQHLLEPAGNGRTTVTIRESLAGPLLPSCTARANCQAGHQRWLTALKPPSNSADTNGADHNLRERD